MSNHAVIDAIRDTAAYQYFIGIPQYQLKAPFDHTALAYFRRRIALISELIRNIVTDEVRQRLQLHMPTKSVLISDATRTPVNIKYPQDTRLQNQARTNLEDDIKGHGRAVSNRTTTHLSTGSSCTIDRLFTQTTGLG